MSVDVSSPPPTTPSPSMPSRCGIRGGGWRRSSSSSWPLLFLYGAATNEAYGWATFGKYILDERIVSGVLDHHRS